MSVPTTPHGFKWSPATPADATALSAVFNSIAEADNTPERLSPETMEHELVSAYAPLEQRTIVARSAGEVVAYGTVYHREAATNEMRTYVALLLYPWVGLGAVMRLHPVCF